MTEEKRDTPPADEPQTPSPSSPADRPGEQPAEQPADATAGDATDRPAPPRRSIRIGSQRSAADMARRAAMAAASESTTESGDSPPATGTTAKAPAAETAGPAATHSAEEAPAATTSEATDADTPAAPADAPSSNQPAAAPAAPVADTPPPTTAEPPASEATDDGAAPAGPPKPRFPPPRLSRSSPEIDAEVEAAMAGMSLDELVTDEQVQAASQSLETESRHMAAVAKIHQEDVFFTIAERAEGIAPLRQFREPPAIGDKMQVVVTGYDAEEGLYNVSVPGASIEVGDWSDVTEGAVVEAVVTGHNKGGLEVEVSKLRGFIPMSQISTYRVENAEDYVGQKLQCVVTEANAERRNLVLSHRAILERDKEANRAKLLEELEVGATREGVVRKIMDFGAFVDIGGLDGLVHVSKLSWDRVKHPSDVLKEGEKITVKVEKVDRASGKIGLSYRDTQDHPWEGVEERFPVGAIVPGEVSKVMDFGAFVKLAPGVEGLVHISELADHRVVRVTNVVKEGQQIEVKILSVDRENQRISLSLKQARAPAEPTEAEQAAAETDEPEEPPRELAVPARKKPLKGGVGKSTGGDQFGLKW